MTTVIKIKNVLWKRDGEVLLNNINWQVNKGEHWAILGLNGSGKTTLLNMVNGYIWPTTGKITVLGNMFGKTDLRNLRKRIGWVSSSLQEKIKGTNTAEAIILSGKHASIGLYEQPEKTDVEFAYQLMKKLGIEYLQNRPYQTVSQGEKQRILVARGLMAKPDLLILDEPTNGLDFLAREELLSFINQLAKQHDAPTIIFVTHHIEEVLPVFSHVLLLRDGTIFQKGLTNEITSSAVLSEFYQIPVEVTKKSERTWISLRRQ
ncbi:ABC transporter ATP-binding protein [Virgibacillus proomii]|uniref:ABC transporter ATP-binding protein n=1 Tax=Virgibacillus proomii TaxID=84407 RepID=UPI001C1255C7|nr:ABC transporter ATP-binding protein [Virgibacillus proomii]MBU5266884.1 ABC transporter ATP-binding protein [Virgibacillus proomii]